MDEVALYRKNNSLKSMPCFFFYGYSFKQYTVLSLILSEQIEEVLR